MPVDLGCGRKRPMGEMVEVFMARTKSKASRKSGGGRKKSSTKRGGRAPSARSKTGAKRKSTTSKRGGRTTARRTSGRKTARKTSGRKASSRSARSSARSTRTAARKESRSSGQRGRKSRAGQTSGEDGGQNQVEGEGSYTASRHFRAAQTGFVRRNRGRIPKMGKDAEAALEGPQGDELRAAEDEARSHGAGEEE